MGGREWLSYVQLEEWTQWYRSVSEREESWWNLQGIHGSCAGFWFLQCQKLQRLPTEHFTGNTVAPVVWLVLVASSFLSCYWPSLGASALLISSWGWNWSRSHKIGKEKKKERKKEKLVQQVAHSVLSFPGRSTLSRWGVSSWCYHWLFGWDNIAKIKLSFLLFSCDCSQIFAPLFSWSFLSGLQSVPSVVLAGVLCCHCRVRLFANPWTVAHQAPPSMGILQARILE